MRGGSVWGGAACFFSRRPALGSDIRSPYGLGLRNVSGHGGSCRDSDRDSVYDRLPVRHGKREGEKLLVPLRSPPGAYLSVRFCAVSSDGLSGAPPVWGKRGLCGRYGALENRGSQTVHRVCEGRGAQSI